MRAIHRGLATYGGSCLLVAAVTVMRLLGACATPPMAVNTDPRFTLGHIRSVYVMPFASPDGNGADVAWLERAEPS